MSKYLRDISFWFAPKKENASQISYETNFLELLYLDCLPKVAAGGIAKIVVCPQRMVVGDPLKVSTPGVIHFSREFDFAQYERSDKQTRKRIALEFLHSSLIQIAQIQKWDNQPFLEAYEAVLEKNIVNERPWGKSVAGPKKIKAQPWCNYDSDKAQIYIAFFTGSELLEKVWVTDVQPGDVWINEAIGKLEWESERDVKLTSRDGLSSWRCTVKNEPRCQSIKRT